MTRRYRVTVIRADGSSGRSDVIIAGDGREAIRLASYARARTPGASMPPASLFAQLRVSVVAERLGEP